MAYLATHELIKVFSNQDLFFGQIWFVAILKYNNSKHTDCMYSELGSDLGPSSTVIHLLIATVYQEASGIIQELDLRKPWHEKAD